MLPSAGCFKTLLCPYFNENDSCSRPFCHYKHENNRKPAETSAKKSKSKDKLQFEVTMETLQFKFRDQIESFENHFDLYLKNKSRDCILYSEDGSKFKVHKEMFGQTDFLRKILSSTKDHCCGTIEVICPCSKEELKHLVNFLYDGEIHCEKESDALKIIDNLQKIFDFPRNLTLEYQNGGYFTSDDNIEASAVTDEVLENISDNSDVQEIVIIPVEEEHFDQEQGENDNDFDSQESENDNLKNTTAEGIDRSNGSMFECGSDEAQADAEKNSNARNIQKKSKYDAENIVIIPLRSRDVSGKRVASDEGKKDNVLDNVEEKKKLKKIPRKKVKRSSFKCTYCGKSSNGKRNFQRHVNAVHLKIKPHECDQCEKSFAHKAVLKRHQACRHDVKIHQEIKAHKCQRCNRSFSRKESLSCHVKRVHLNKKPLKKFLCNECEAPFENKQSLEYHMNKVHLNVKPYKCNLCEKGFFIKPLLKKHVC